MAVLHEQEEVVELIQYHHTNNEKDEEASDGSANDSTDNEVDDVEVTPNYKTLLTDFRNFRWFIASYIVTHAGEWLTYLGSLSMIQSNNYSNDNNTSSSLAISLLVICRLVPTAVVGPLGGVLADSYDRRRVMVWLDIAGGVVALVFLLACHVPTRYSNLVLYIATLLQETITGLYEPSRSAIVPQLLVIHTTDKDDKVSSRDYSKVYLPKATTLCGWVWSILTAIGSSLGGFVVAVAGIQACFLVDCATYLLSAYILYAYVKGEYNDEDDDKERSDDTEAIIHKSTTSGMLRETLVYLVSSAYGPWVLVKFCGAVTFGASDVMNVGFAEDAITSELHSERLGALFGMVGVGCFVFPALLQRYFSETIIVWQWTCGLAFVLLSIGYYGLSFHRTFFEKLIWTMIRAGGASVLWINSCLILQTTTPARLLGRVMAIDLTMATLGEAVSALLAGILQDYDDFDPENLALVLAVASIVFAIIWLSYVAFVMPKKVVE